MEATHDEDVLDHRLLCCYSKCGRQCIKFNFPHFIQQIGIRNILLHIKTVLPTRIIHPYYKHVINVFGGANRTVTPTTSIPATTAVIPAIISAIAISTPVRIMSTFTPTSRPAVAASVATTASVIAWTTRAISLSISVTSPARWRSFVNLTLGAHWAVVSKANVNSETPYHGSILALYRNLCGPRIIKLDKTKTAAKNRRLGKAPVFRENFLNFGDSSFLRRQVTDEHSAKRRKLLPQMSGCCMQTKARAASTEFF